MKSEILNGWYLSIDDELWAYYIDDIFTGLEIYPIPDYEQIRYGYLPYHIRFYSPDNTFDFDIGDASTLEEAKSLAELYYSRERESKDL